MKTIKINHVVLTLKLSPAGQGMERNEIDDLVNKRLAEGYDDVQVNFIRTNHDERQQATDLVNQYIFRKYEEVPVKAK